MTTEQTIDTGAGYQPGHAAMSDDKSAEGQQPASDTTKAAEGGEQKAPDADKPKGDRLAALIKERRDSRSETSQLQRTVSDLQQTVQGLSPKAQAEVADWKNPHDPTEAPMDHLRAEIDHIVGVVNQAKQDVGEQLTQQQQQQALADYERGLTVELGTVAQNVPELAEAHQAITQHFMRTAQLQGLSGVALGNAARNAMLGAYLQHANAGKDAVTATVEMAQAIGFQAQGGRGQIKTPDAVARGQMAAATSLGGATGNTGATSPPDIRSLTKMSRAELLKDGGANLKRLKAQLRGEV